jgi:Flp pilus assembly protein CpaB
MDRRRIILIAVLLIVLVLLFVSKMFSGGENSPNSDTGKIESVGLLKMVPKNKKNELQNIPKIEIIVSNRNISVGEIFTKDMVRWRSWPENALEDGAITKESWPEILDKIQEYIATTDFQIGEPITRLKINKMSTASFISAALRSGMTAAPIWKSVVAIYS